MSVLSEVSAVFTGLANYLKTQRDYVNSGTGSSDISTIEDLRYEESLTYVTSNSQGSPGFEIGSVQEAIMTADAVSRECFMGALVKSEIYDDILTDMDKDIKFYQSSEAYLSGVASGHSTTGSRS
jgi:hypothetical protein